MYVAGGFFKFLKVVLASKMNNGLLVFIDTVAWTRILKSPPTALFGSYLQAVLEQENGMVSKWN